MSGSDPERSAEGRMAAMACELRAAAADDGEGPSPGALRELLVAATLAYGTVVRRRGHELSLAHPDLTPTDAVVLCCALLNAQDLNPFDLTLWFGRVAPDPGTERPLS